MATLTPQQIKAQYSDPYAKLRETIMSGQGTNDNITQLEQFNRQANQARGLGDTITATKDLDYLKGLIPKTATATQQPQAQPRQTYSTPTVRNNSGMIKDAYKSNLNSIVSQIKSAIANSKQGYNSIIQDAPQQFQGAKNQSELGRMRGLDTLRETIANRGDSGGLGRSELLQTDIAGQNQLNSINSDQNRVITDAQRAIQNLEEQGRFAEAEAVSDNAYKMLQSLIGENSRIDDMNLNIGQMLGSYGGQRTLQGQQIDRGNFESDRSFDYQQTLDELNRQDQQREIDWQRSANNPAYKSQLLQNEIDAIKLANLPQQIKDEATQIQQQLQAGQIDLDMAKEQLRQLKQPRVSGGGSSGGSGSSGGLGLNW